MSTSSSLRSFDRLLTAPDGGLPGIPGGGPTGLPGSGGADPYGAPNLQKPGAVPPPPPPPSGTPIFQQPTPPPPAGVPNGGTFELSGWWRRVGATLLDGLIVGIVWIPLVIAAFTIFGLSIDSSGNADDTSLAIGGGAFVVAFVLGLVVTLLYAPFFMARTNGATLGKRAAGIRVVRADGLPMTFGFAAVREIAVKGLLLGAISSVTFSLPYLVNYLWPLWDSEHRALHDMVVKTRVVRA